MISITKNAVFMRLVVFRKRLKVLKRRRRKQHGKNFIVFGITFKENFGIYVYKVILWVLVKIEIISSKILTHAI